MAGFVRRSYVGLGFNNPTYGCSVRMLSYQIFAEQLSGNFDRWLFVKGAA
jgi:hypothetical protein